MASTSSTPKRKSPVPGSEPFESDAKVMGKMNAVKAVAAASSDDADAPAVIHIDDEDAATIQTAENAIAVAQQLLGRVREESLNAEAQLMQTLAKARSDHQSVLVTVGRKNGIKKIGTAEVHYSYDAPSQTYSRTR